MATNPSPSKLIVPILLHSTTPTKTVTKLELIEDEWVIPRLVERIAELEEKLRREEQVTQSLATSSSPSSSTLLHRLTAVLASGIDVVDTSLSYLYGDDKERQAAHAEATSRALAITVQRMNTLKAQRCSLEDQLRALQEDMKASKDVVMEVQRENKALSLQKQQLMAELSATRAQYEAAREENCRITTDLRLAISQRDNISCELDTTLGQLRHAHAQRDSLFGDLQAALSERDRLHQQQAALHALCEDKCERATTAITESHRLRTVLDKTRREMEEFQKRYLAERLERRRLVEGQQLLGFNEGDGDSGLVDFNSSAGTVVLQPTRIPRLSSSPPPLQPQSKQQQESSPCTKRKENIPEKAPATANTLR